MIWCSLHDRWKSPTAAHSLPAFTLSLLSASDVSRLANTKQLGVSHSLKQYSIMAPCRPVITNSLSDGWTLFCRMSDKWLLCTNQSTFMDKIQSVNSCTVEWRQTPKHLCGQIHSKHSSVLHFDTEAHVKCLWYYIDDTPYDTIPFHRDDQWHPTCLFSSDPSSSRRDGW